MKKENKLTDERLISWLYNRGIQTQEELRSFLNPSLSQLHNPFELSGVREASNLIKTGINAGKRFAIVGDYDCDGIMAATLLYQYFIAQNANVKVFIPNRFDDGYGLNDELSKQIINEFNPDILITVDLGISCAKEIEFLKNQGVTVIVTDHHEPQNKIPDCLVIDPKVDSNYQCSFLCGAGVAFKLVSALAGNEFANKFLDIAGIATIGDIVPLLDENRAIAAAGLKAINAKNFSLPSVEYLFKTLELDDVSCADIYLKIVPKINASGRMDNGLKVFNFINSSNASEREQLLASILTDNAQRLEKINEAMAQVNACLASFNEVNQPIICVKGNFHQGILGILASRIVSDFRRPAIVFAKTSDGTLKASGRSVDGIDLHALILKNAELCMHFGGHKMAVGLEIASENYVAFISKIRNDLSLAINPEECFIDNTNPDIIISSKDISLKFIKELELLEPFGCENPKPSFAIICRGAVPFKSLSTKSSNHLKLVNNGEGTVIYFNGIGDAEVLESSAGKQIMLDLEINHFNKKEIPQAIVKQVKLLDMFKPVSSEMAMASLALFYIKNVISEVNARGKINSNSNAKSNFGNIIFALFPNDYNNLDKLDLTNFIISNRPTLSRQNCVVISSEVDFSNFNCEEFNNITILSAFADKNKPISAQTLIEDFKIKDVRTKCGLIYSAIAKNQLCGEFDSIFEFSHYAVELFPNLKPYEVVVAVYALAELGIVTISDKPFSISHNETQHKFSLFDSKIISFFGRNDG